ncbi:MAG: tRNA (adenosine(37)-N6)-threonylcarbamoyltransferase complex ATPase subunit type 1 TsaE [Planctomycetes bacterium]|nr:tRNA (adenosine(37)-N6)-threonylcarbamoyltransferase complex ATPase subunit type 1 TsaE [Planctomycetota bacterium]
MPAELLHRLGTLLCAGPEATEALGERIGRIAPAGLVIALDGELGSGKTCFVRGLARGLDVTDAVSSPTFALQHAHQGRLELWHFDAWRASSGAALLQELGPAELGRGAVLAVEWAARVRELLPPPRLEIEFLHVAEHERRLELRVRGALEPSFVTALARILIEPGAAWRVEEAADPLEPPPDPPRR